MTITEKMRTLLEVLPARTDPEDFDKWNAGARQTLKALLKDLYSLADQALQYKKRNNGEYGDDLAGVTRRLDTARKSAAEALAILSSF